MNVRDLIAKLNGLDPELPVMCIQDDHKVPEGQPCPIFDIDDIYTAEADASRGDDGEVTFSFTSSETSRTYAMLQVTLDY